MKKRKNRNKETTYPPRRPSKPFQSRVRTPYSSLDECLLRLPLSPHRFLSQGYRSNQVKAEPTHYQHLTGLGRGEQARGPKEKCKLEKQGDNSEKESSSWRAHGDKRAKNAAKNIMMKKDLSRRWETSLLSEKVESVMIDSDCRKKK